MMKKAAIITLTKDLNYGNRLQNYAVEQLIGQRGYQAATLFNTMWSVYKSTSRFKSYVGIPLTWLKNRKLGILRQTIALFDRFNEQFIHLAEEYDRNSSMNYILNKYDVFITGSDQVWNPYWNFIGEKEYLTFVAGKKKIALSASFGVSKIPENRKKEIAHWLNGLDAISVRETRAAEIVKELTGKDVQILIDPTMCISDKKWLRIAKKPLFFAHKQYVLMYVLGKMPKECLATVLQYCEKTGSDLVVLKDNKIGENCPIGPREYLYLIANAKYVITDSFHGSVFSILFHRNFAVFHRSSKEKNEDMMSRLDTLLSRFSLEKCLMSNEQFAFDNINSEKWKEIDRKLEGYRKEVKRFLDLELR